MKQDIKSMNLPELEEMLRELGQPRFRAKQIFSWLHRGVRSFAEMTNLAKPCGNCWTSGSIFPCRRWHGNRRASGTEPSSICGGLGMETAWRPY